MFPNSSAGAGPVETGEHNRGADAALVPTSAVDQEPCSFAQTVAATFRSFITQPGFPCVAAKAAVNGNAHRIAVYDRLASDAATTGLTNDLATFVAEQANSATDYATFVAVFANPILLSELEFERLLWLQLTRLNRVDASLQHVWNPGVSSDPDDSHFSFSFAERAFFIVGLHAGSSRASRRFPWLALVFNDHQQFVKLREEGRFERMQGVIRERDFELQGTVNPMLSNHGETSEARQYSGRSVPEDWHPPFVAAASDAPRLKCPFDPS